MTFNINRLTMPFYFAAVAGWKYASHAFVNHPPSYKRKQQYRSFFMAFINAKFALKWFEILESQDLKPFHNYRHRLYFKPFQAYMSIKYNMEQRMKIILDTYRFIRSKNDFFFHLLTFGGGIKIAKLKLSDTVEGHLVIGYDERFRKEGEFVLSFQCTPLGGNIASAAFSFEEIEMDCWICKIACVQGHRKNEQNSSKIVRKMLHGLRPKSLIIHALQVFSRELGLVGVYGVGNNIHVYNKKHMIHLSRYHRINFDYDALWGESGGKLKNTGWFELPLIPIRKEIYDLNSSKRALYRRRYIMIDNLIMEISKTVKSFQTLEV